MEPIHFNKNKLLENVKKRDLGMEPTYLVVKIF